jgi:hypothetical protein
MDARMDLDKSNVKIRWSTPQTRTWRAQMIRWKSKTSNRDEAWTRRHKGTELFAHCIAPPESSGDFQNKALDKRVSASELIIITHTGFVWWSNKPTLELRLLVSNRVEQKWLNRWFLKALKCYTVWALKDWSSTKATHKGLEGTRKLMWCTWERHHVPEKGIQ